MNQSRGFWEGIPLDILIGGENYNSPQISPDGKYLSYIKSIDKDKSLHIYDIKQNRHHQLTEDITLSTGTAYGGKIYTWSKDSQVIYFSSKGDLYKLSIEGGIPVEIPTIDKSFAPYCSDKKLVFSVEHDDNMSVGLIHILDERSWPKRIDINYNFLYDVSLNPSNNESAVVHAWDFPNMSWNGSEILLISSNDSDFDSIEIKTIAGSETIATSQPKFSPDGENISFLSEASGWLNLWICNADGSNARQLVNEKMEHAYSTWVTGGSNYVWINNKEIIFTKNVGGNFNLSAVNIETNETRQFNLPDGYYSDLHISNDGDKLICLYQSYRLKQSILLISVFGLLETPDYEPQYLLTSGLKIDYKKYKFIKPTNIEYPTVDGASSHAMVFRTDDTKNAPALFVIHGGPTGMSTNSFKILNQYYASKGWVVVAINHRGSIGFGADYRNKLNGKWGTYDVSDTLDALNYLSEEGIVNPDKTAIIGGSAGGYTVLMSLITHPGVYSAGIDLYGVSDLFLLAEETHYLESHYTDMLVGPLPASSEKYFEYSPLYHAEEIKDPLLILQGEEDPVVPKNQSILIKDKVKGPVELKLYEGEGHGFQKKETLKDMYSRIDSFLKKYVLYNK